MLEQLLDIAEEMGNLCNEGTYEPILEADVSGYIYHALIQRKLPLRRLHLDTRIFFADNDNQRFDLAIGDLDNRPDGQKKRAIIPELVLEAKVFPEDFSDQQHSQHYREILRRDVPKLQTITQTSIARILFLFDEANYLTRSKCRGTKRTKIDEINLIRTKKCKEIQIIYANRLLPSHPWQVQNLKLARKSSS